MQELCRPALSERLMDYWRWRGNGSGNGNGEGTDGARKQKEANSHLIQITGHICCGEWNGKIKLKY
jgi:hypothetical protein